MKETIAQNQVQTRRPLSHVDIVQALRAEVQRNPAFAAVCKLFASRERARQQVTLSTLRLTTIREGYNFTREQHEGVLKFLASLGIGRLVYDHKNRIAVLKDIRVTLQSIGLAATSSSDTVHRFEPAYTFKPLTPEMQQTKRQMVEEVPLKMSKKPDTESETKMEAPKEKKQVDKKDATYPVALLMKIDGTQVSFELPKGITTKEIGQILAELYARK